MEFLASCSLEESKGFSGKLVIPDEDAKKPDKVSLNIVTDDEDIFNKLSGAEKCITYTGIKPLSVNCVPKKYYGRVFNETNLDVVTNERGTYPLSDKRVPTLVRLPEGFSDMKLLYEMSKEDPEIRFIGGNLLGIEGIKIGRFDTGKEKMLPVFNGLYDTFVEVELNDLDGIQEIAKKARKRCEAMETSGKKKKSSPKVKATKDKKVPKKAIAFTKLFTGGEEEF